MPAAPGRARGCWLAAAVAAALLTSGASCGPGPAGSGDTTGSGPQPQNSAEPSRLPRAASGLPVIELRVGSRLLRAEVAARPTERHLGLMHRAEVPPGTGMLFVFPTQERHSFWMKDTQVSLSIAFIATDGTVVDVLDMEAYSEESHMPRAPARFALEVARGWYAEAGLKAGDRIEIPEVVLLLPGS